MDKRVAQLEAEIVEAIKSIRIIGYSAMPSGYDRGYSAICERCDLTIARLMAVLEGEGENKQ